MSKMYYVKQAKVDFRVKYKILQAAEMSQNVLKTAKN
jgi:hypothetical protein